MARARPIFRLGLSTFTDGAFVGKYESCMVSKLPIIFKRTRRCGEEEGSCNPGYPNAFGPGKNVPLQIATQDVSRHVKPHTAFFLHSCFILPLGCDSDTCVVCVYV